jgi:glycosyl transferase, family 25
MNNQPPIYVINMARDVARIENMAQQFSALGLTFERVEAVDGRLLGSEKRREVYSRFWFSLLHGRSASAGELGCALSHRKIYELMVERNQNWALIFEDDVLLNKTFAENISAIEMETRNFELVQLFAFGTPNILQSAPTHAAFRIMRFSGAHSSAAAYGLRLSGAKKLLVLIKIRVAADKWSWLRLMTGLKACVVSPFLVTLDERHSEVSTIAVTPGDSRKAHFAWRVLVLPFLRIVRFAMLKLRDV